MRNLQGTRKGGNVNIVRQSFIAIICMGIFVWPLLPVSAEAAHDEIPRIPIGQLKELMDRGADIVILDAQQKSTYDQGHIKGALSLPWASELKEADVEQLPKNKLIVTYCDCGPGENDSADVASQLMELGFTEVKVLADPSIRGWKQSGFPLEK
jgi:rhodanese-related sulfurtransferase